MYIAKEGGGAHGGMSMRSMSKKVMREAKIKRLRTAFQVRTATYCSIFLVFLTLECLPFVPGIRRGWEWRDLLCRAPVRHEVDEDPR